MAFSRVTKIGDGVSTQYPVNFTLGYIDPTHITARVGDEVDGLGNPVYRAITFLGPNIFQIAGTPAGIGVPIVFERTVPKESLIVNFSNGDVLDEVNLDTSQLQTIMAVQEVLDGRFTASLGTDLDFGNFTGINTRSPTAPTDLANKKYVDDRTGDLVTQVPAILAASAAATAAAASVAAAGNSRSLLSFIPSNLHAAIKDYSSTVDLTTYLQSAFTSGENLTMPRGRYNTNDWLYFVREGQSLIGESMTASGTGGGFFNCGSGFNFAANRPYVLGGVPFSHVENVFIQFYQPPTATSKAQLLQYPWAMSAAAAQRSTWKNIGWGAAFNGFDGRGVSLANHPGGSFIHRVSDGALNIGGHFQDLYDFIDIDGWHGWEYGYTSLSNVRLINFSEPKYLIFGKDIESLQVGRLHLWMMTLANTETSTRDPNIIFKRVFGAVKFDGWASKFEWQKGQGAVGILEMYCDKNTPHNLIEVQAGECSVGVLNIRNQNAHTSPMVKVTGGRFSAATGKIQTTGNGFAAEVTGGELDLGTVKVVTGGNTSRTLPVFKQTGSAGKLTLSGTSIDAVGTGNGDFAALENSAGGNRLLGCDFNGYRLNSLTAIGNEFVGLMNVGKAGEWLYGLKDFTHAQTATSTTSLDIAEIYIDSNPATQAFGGAAIEVEIEGLIQGAGAGAASGKITVTRNNVATLSTPVVANTMSSGLGSLAITAVISSNVLVIRATFSASASGSYIRSFCRVVGGNPRVKKL